MSNELTREDNINALSRLREMGRIAFKGNPYYFSGSNLQIFCPHHKDKNPSLRVELNRGVWTCFSCHREGNINTLCLELIHLPVREFLGLDAIFDFKATYEKHVAPPPTFPPTPILGFTTPALETRATYSYLKKRKIQESIVLSMKMLYSDDCSINGSNMRERLLIPMYNDKNEIINVECRSLDLEKNPPKVLYPKNTFKPLYDEHNLDLEKPLYLVEGLMDLARLREDNRFSNSTATFGTGLSDFQREALNNFNQIILIPDNDEPGLTFAKTLKEIFRDKFSVMSIRDTSIKDVGDIPISITEFYNKNGFINHSSFMF